MTLLPAAGSRTFALFTPPYQELVHCGPEIISTLTDVEQWKGTGLVWQLTPGAELRLEFDALREKTPGLPLLVLLPPACDIPDVATMLPMVRLLNPRLILPHGMLDVAYRLKQVFGMPPRSLPAVTTDYLIRRGILRNRKSVLEFRRLLELAPEVRSIAALSKRMYTSRRTLGRHFTAEGLPVPSHCLQFARLLHAAVALQADDTAMFRIASRFGFPDGFTMSNQMKRIIGYRPSEVRELLGWEWLVESWMKREGIR